MQTEYSLWARDVEPEILPACREFDVAFVPYAPLGRGLLAGTVRKLDDIAPNDKRRKQPRFQPGNLERNLELLEAGGENRGRPRRDHRAGRARMAICARRGYHSHPGHQAAEVPRAERGGARFVLTPAELELLAHTFKPGARAGDRYNPGYFEMLGV